jgi:DNA-binding transcriptional ArsR family regulator
MLTKVNGFELMEYSRPLNIPVIVVTAKSDVIEKVKGLKLGADDYLTKPFEIVELLARVETVLRRYRGEASIAMNAVRRADKRCVWIIQRRFKPNGRQTSNLYILLDNQQQRIEPQKQDSTIIKDKTSNICKPINAFSKLQLFKCSLSAFQSGLSSNAIKVYSCLSFRAGKEGQTFPTKREITLDCKGSLSTVSRGIKALKEAGLMTLDVSFRSCF